jgi:hypothetical protein
MLEDPELLDVPLVYITSRRPFAFSERERKNLQRYLANGGFLLFSNAADSASEALGVANSIEFELWRVLGKVGHDLVDIGEDHQTSSFLPSNQAASSSSSNQAASSSSLNQASSSLPLENQSLTPPLKNQTPTPPLKNQTPTPPLKKGAGGIYRSFFRLPSSLGLRGIVLNGRISVLYEDSGYGAAWLAERDGEREPYLRLGVNIIVYALTTSPMVQRN